MLIGFPSLRTDESNNTHHLWCNNGTWWIHYTIHFGHRARRIRKSLRTRSLQEARASRDAHLAAVQANGEPVPDRRPNARVVSPVAESVPTLADPPSLTSASAL
jgi:hypothetical protein